MATYARIGGVLIAILLQTRNLPVKKIENRSRFDKIMAKSLWFHLLAHSLYIGFQKRPPFLFFNNFVKNQPISMIFDMFSPEKIRHTVNSLQTRPPHLSDVAILPWEIQKNIHKI